MSEEDIKDAWELTKGGNMPREFRATVDAFRRYKGAFSPQEFTESDFATCVMFYTLFSMQKKGKKEEVPNG